MFDHWNGFFSAFIFEVLVAEASRFFFFFLASSSLESSPSSVSSSTDKTRDLILQESLNKKFDMAGNSSHSENGLMELSLITS